MDTTHQIDWSFVRLSYVTEVEIISCWEEGCPAKIAIEPWPYTKSRIEEIGWHRWAGGLWHCPTCDIPWKRNREEAHRRETERQERVNATLLLSPAARSLPLNRTQAIRLKKQIIEDWVWNNNPLHVRRLPDGHYAVCDPECNQTWPHIQAFLTYLSSSACEA